jgi:hypothetical protein
MVQSGPQVPSPLLADIGKSRFGRFRRMVVLERFDGTAWTPVARFGSVRAADVALDEALASGMQPDHVRVVEVGPSTGARALMVLGIVVATVLVVWWAFVSFGPA